MGGIGERERKGNKDLIHIAAILVCLMVVVWDNHDNSNQNASCRGGNAMQSWYFCIELSWRL